MRAAGADVVAVSAHSVADTFSSYGDELPYPENASSLLAEQVPGIDAIVVGHAHQEIPQRYVSDAGTGKQRSCSTNRPAGARACRSWTSASLSLIAG